MKNLLLILLLANILYFLYGWVSEDDKQRGEITVDETELGPSLQLADEGGGESPAIETRSAESDDASLEDTSIPVVSDADAGGQSDEQDPEVDTPSLSGVSQPIELTAVIGRSCVSLGPLRERDDATRAQTQYAGEGMKATVRSTIGTRRVGNWVKVRNIATYDRAQEMLTTLKDGGLADAYIAESEDDGITIYLGLFSQAAGAERIELQATSLGVPAIIVPEIREGSVYYVDIALSPGRGAGEMVEKYGEENVLLREQATCPN